MDFGLSSAPTAKDWLEGDPVDNVSVESKTHGFPEMADVVRRDGHRERDGQIGGAAVLDGLLPHFSEVGPTEFLLASGLDAIELEVELKPKAVESSVELLGELRVFGKEHAVRVDEHEVDLRVLLEPAAELEQLRMQRGFAAADLEDFNAALAINDTLNTRFDLIEWHRIDLRASADGRIRITGGAGEVAGIDDFNQRKAGRKHLERLVAMGLGILPECARFLAISGTTSASRAAAVLFLAHGEPVETGVLSEASTELPMRRTSPLHEDLIVPLHDLCWAGSLADRAAGGGGFEEADAGWVRSGHEISGGNPLGTQRSF